jgi:N-methylhydantoinase A
MSGTGLVAGVDVGGTFTDLVIFDPASGLCVWPRCRRRCRTSRAGCWMLPSRPGPTWRHRPDRPRHHDHHQCRVGTPVGEDRADHHDGLSRRAGAWPPHQAAGLWHAWGFHPVIPRDLRLEVPERMDARGRVLTGAGRRRAAGSGPASARSGLRGLVIHFLHAYANPAHELRAGEIAPKPLAE